jgi:hypothetical protein
VTTAAALESAMAQTFAPAAALSRSYSAGFSGRSTPGRRVSTPPGYVTESVRARRAAVGNKA